MDDTLLAQLPDSLTAEVDGKVIPLRETPFIKEAKDFASFAKTAYDAHREVGARIPVKVDPSKPETITEWRKTHLPTLYKNGILPQPPASPKDYGVVKPTDIPEGLQWDDARAERYATTLHKYGVSKEIVPELMELHREALVGQASALKTSVDEGMAALKAEYGDKFDERAEMAKRLTSYIFKSPEEVDFYERLGLGNHPGFLSVIMRLAPLAMSDSSMAAALKNGSDGGGQMTPEDVRAEIADIMNNKNNPRNALYWKSDKKTLEYIDELYKKAYGDTKVAL